MVAFDCPLLLRCGSGTALHSTMLMHLFLHGVELLLLRVGQDSVNLAPRSVLNRLHFCVAICLGQRLIRKDLLALLIARRQNGFDLRLLIGCLLYTSRCV